MRIAFIGIALPPIMGGLEVHIWELAKHLAQNGNDVHVFGVQKYRGRVLPEFEFVDGVSVHRVSGTISLGRFEFYELAHVMIGLKIFRMRSNPFDLLHGHCVYPSGIACRLVNALNRLPYVITSHGDEIMEFGKNLLYKWLRINVTRNIFRFASQVIAVSKELENLSIHFGASSQKTVCFPNAIDVNRFTTSGSRKEIRKQLKLPLDKNIVLSLRRLSIKNGVQYLVQAAMYVVQEETNTLFLICGDGELRPFLQEKISELGLTHHFLFVGSIPNNEVPLYIHASDLAVFPSLAEATSIACLEVMACGVPVVASNVGGLSEIIQDGETGILINFGLNASTFKDPGLPQFVVEDFAKGIIRLLKEPSYRFQIGEKASRYVRASHDWSSYVNRITVLYNLILSGKLNNK